MFVRLILEKQLLVDQILVVTFTNAATEELRDRIRNKLLQAKEAFSKGSSADLLIDAFMNQHENPAMAMHLIHEALISFDRAAIYTIHGFCQRILYENAFETGKLFDTELVTDQTEVIQEVVDLMREVADRRGVQLRAELGEGTGRHSFDRTALYRAILDLVTNAIDACAESEVESGHVVSLETHATADEIVVTVADNGIGMSDHVRSNLFVRFFSTKGGQGTGLGLPVVKKVVEEHGGALEVESTLGEGSAFHLRFPRSP